VHFLSLKALQARLFLVGFASFTVEKLGRGHFADVRKLFDVSGDAYPALQR
jgi:hypothetical protein